MDTVTTMNTSNAGPSPASARIPEDVAARVRPARRPPGWVAPGPRPAGPPEDFDSDPELWPGPGEDLCHLTGDWRIFQRLEGHRYSLDDLVTAWYALDGVRGRPVARAADLGCGIGSVLMMVAWGRPEARVVGVEAQPLSAGLARRSLRYNGAADRCEVRGGDLRDPAMTPEGAVFDLVTGTPPYIPLGHGTVSAREQCGPCRFETRGGVEGYCEAAARLLAPGGRFAVCESAGQTRRVELAAREAGLTVLSRRDVVPREGRQALLSVYRMARADEVAAGADGAPLQIEAPLVVRDRAGRWTPDFLKVRADMGMPCPPVS